MPGLITSDQQFRDDDGSPDPRLSTALSTYAAGRGSEHAVLAALVGTRLLVPVVAAAIAPQEAGIPAARARGPEKTSQLAMPTLTGRDGRPAMIAFTSLAALRGWRTDARPLPVAADKVCQAAVAEAVPALVIDVAGPVPLVLEGARLAALAAGQPPPRPAEDPDVRATVEAAARADPDIAAVSLLASSGDTDLTVRLVLSRGAAATSSEATARRAATAIMGALAGRFRRGIEIAVEPGRPARRR